MNIEIRGQGVDGLPLNNGEGEFFLLRGFGGNCAALILDHVIPWSWGDFRRPQDFILVPGLCRYFSKVFQS